MKKRVFMSWVLGILALLILLIILIVRMEPDKPGITRAQAAKAAALFAVSRETCIQYEEETGRSHFPEKERRRKPPLSLPTRRSPTRKPTPWPAFWERAMGTW